MSAIDLEVKACAEAFQATQKRTRAALFLSILASCIVLLMVFNLIESRRLRKTDLIVKTASDSSEYLKKVAAHVADQSYYQLPLLGIQITCDDVGLLGPLALFVFSMYSMMAFKASACQIKCLTSDSLVESRLVRTLIEAEQIPGSSLKHPDWPSIPQAILIFLPSVACVAVIGYDVYAHILPPSNQDPLYEILLKLRGLAITVDIFGAIAAFGVPFYNYQAFRFLRTSQARIKRCLSSHPIPHGRPATQRTRPVAAHSL